MLLMKPAGGEKDNTTPMSKLGYGYRLISMREPSAANAGIDNNGMMIFNYV